MLTGMKELLNIAQARGCAIPAFNVYNAETALGVIFAAEEAKACVILQMYSRLFTSYERSFSRRRWWRLRNAQRLKWRFIWITGPAMRPLSGRCAMVAPASCAMLASCPLRKMSK